MQTFNAMWSWMLHELYTYPPMKIQVLLSGIIMRVFPVCVLEICYNNAVQWLKPKVMFQAILPQPQNTNLFDGCGKQDNTGSQTHQHSFLYM